MQTFVYNLKYWASAMDKENPSVCKKNCNFNNQFVGRELDILVMRAELCEDIWTFWYLTWKKVINKKIKI